MRLTILLLILLVPSMGFSTTTKPKELFPACVQIKPKVQNKLILLDGPTEKNGFRVYFLKNNYQKSLWIDHPSNKPKTAWSTYIRSGNWSVLKLDNKTFSLNCAVISPGHVDELSCSQVLSVCEHSPDKKFRKGTYWVAENKHLTDLQADFFPVKSTSLHAK